MLFLIRVFVSQVDVARVVAAGTFERWNRSVVGIHEREVALRLERDMEARLETRIASLTVGDDGGADKAVAVAVRHITDRILTLRCPVKTVYSNSKLSQQKNKL